MSGTLTPDRTAARLCELSSDARAAVLLDAAGALVGSSDLDPERARMLGDLARELFETVDRATRDWDAEPAEQVEVQVPSGAAFASRTPRWTLAVVARRGAPASLVLFDPRAGPTHEGQAQGPDRPRRRNRGRGGGGGATHAAGARAARARVRPDRVRAPGSAGGPRPRADPRDRRADGPARHRRGGTRWRQAGWRRGGRRRWLPRGRLRGGCVTLVEPALATRVLERALARGGELAELYAEARRGFSLSLDDRRVERPQGGRERGACVRVVQGESSYYGYVDGVEEGDLLRVADLVAPALRGGGRRPAALSAATRAKRHPVLSRPEEIEPIRKADLLRACDERARAAGVEVSQARFGYAESRRLVEVFNSDGRVASDDRTRVRLSAQVIARRDGRVETGSETRGG